MFGIAEVNNLPPWAKELPQLLAHGSGINGDWHIEGKHGYIRLSNSYHAMDQMGGYDGWADFTAILRPKKITQPDGSSYEYLDVAIHFNGSYSNRLATKYDLRNYLAETITNSLTDFKWGQGIVRVLRKSDAIQVQHTLEDLRTAIGDGDTKVALWCLEKISDRLTNAFKEVRDV
jgi:hypothetical protein